MENNHIRKAIEFLEYVEARNGIVDEFSVDFGVTEKEPWDEGYCEGVVAKKHDGTFTIRISGYKFD